MNVVPRRIKHIMRAANIATVTTTVITSLFGKKEAGSAAAPLNAVSHILWGDKAFEKEGVDTKHTAAGAAVHAAAVYAWTGILELTFGKWVRRGEDDAEVLGRALIAGGTISALAYVVDYHVVPKRLTPGFEKHLSPLAIASTYGILAASLAAGAVWAERAEA